MSVGLSFLGRLNQSNRIRLKFRLINVRLARNSRRSVAHFPKRLPGYLLPDHRTPSGLELNDA
jgi:hypothetical protein